MLAGFFWPVHIWLPRHLRPGSGSGLVIVMSFSAGTVPLSLTFRHISKAAGRRKFYALLFYYLGTMTK